MKRVVILIFFACLLTGLTWVVNGQYRKAKRIQKAAQESSKMMQLRTALATEIERYFHEHGEYPKTLKELPLTNLNWGTEGATVKDLDSFLYESDGQTFILQWTGSVRIYLAGKSGTMTFSEAEANKIGIDLDAN